MFTEWEDDSMMDVLLWAAVYCCCMWDKLKDVQVMNGLVNELEHKWPLVIISHCSGDALLSHCSAEKMHHSKLPKPTAPHPTLALFCLFLISTADLSHAGAESLWGVSIFNYLSPPFWATRLLCEGRHCTAGEKQQNANFLAYKTLTCKLNFKTKTNIRKAH